MKLQSLKKQLEVLIFQMVFFHFTYLCLENSTQNSKKSDYIRRKKNLCCWLKNSCGEWANSSPLRRDRKTRFHKAQLLFKEERGQNGCRTCQQDPAPQQVVCLHPEPSSPSTSCSLTCHRLPSSSHTTFSRL